MVPSSLRQLTYTSYSPGEGRQGGWQVKEAIGLDWSEASDLARRFSTRFDWTSAISQYPTRAEQAQLPRRLVYMLVHMTDSQRGLLVHTIPAGEEATGRPGNVFVHAMVSDPEGPLSRLRPVELWRSPDWLTPFGQSGVREAALKDLSDPRPGDVVNRRETLGLLRRSWSAATNMACLLDAIRARRPVLMTTREIDAAALWAGVASRFTSLTWARILPFAVCESPKSALRALETGALMACAPGAAVSTPPDLPGAAVLLDEDIRVELGAGLGTSHRTALGVEVAVTPWSLLAAEALRKDSINVILDKLDDGLDNRVPAMDWNWESPLRQAIEGTTDLIVVRAAQPNQRVDPAMPTLPAQISPPTVEAPTPQGSPPAPTCAAPTGSLSATAPLSLSQPASPVPPPPPPYQPPPTSWPATATPTPQTTADWLGLSDEELDRTLTDPAARRATEALLVDTTSDPALIALCDRLARSGQTPPDLRAWSQLRLDADRADRYRGLPGLWRRWRVAGRAGRQLLRRWGASITKGSADAATSRRSRP